MSIPFSPELPATSASGLPIWPEETAFQRAKGGDATALTHTFDEPWYEFAMDILPGDLSPAGRSRRLAVKDVKPFVWAVHELVAREVDENVGLAGRNRNPDPDINPMPIPTGPKAAFTRYFSDHFIGFLNHDMSSFEYRRYTEAHPADRVADIIRHYPEISVIRGLTRAYENHHQTAAANGLRVFEDIHHQWVKLTFGTNLPRKARSEPTPTPSTPPVPSQRTTIRRGHLYLVPDLSE
jgi:hypothetical protein